MPGQPLKDLYLCKNTEDLQKEANKAIEFSYLGYKRILQLAEKTFDKAKLHEYDGDEECAYVCYMRAFNAYNVSRNARDYVDSRDRVHWKGLVGSNMNVALHRAEQLFPSLQRRFNLRQEMEEAARMEAMESRNRGDDTVGQYSQNSGSTAKLEKDVHTNGDSEASCDGNVRASMTAFELYQKLEKEPTKFLILDTRDRDAYHCHIKTPSCINVPLNELQGCYTAKKFEERLPIADRTLFRKRRSFEYIILVDVSSDNADEAFQPGKPLGVLRSALHLFSNDPTQRPPLLLLGGFESWYLSFPSLCTQPNSYESPAYMNDKQGQENYFPESYPNFDDFLNFQETKYFSEEITTAASIPQIPDRTKKPPFTRLHSNGVHGVPDVGDYVQIQIPNSSWKPSPDRGTALDISPATAEEQTQKVFDETVSKHIDMREALNSIGEKFSRLNGGSEGTSTSQTTEANGGSEKAPVSRTADAPFSRLDNVSEKASTSQAVKVLASGLNGGNGKASMSQATDVPAVQETVVQMTKPAAPVPDRSSKPTTSAPVPDRSSKPNTGSLTPQRLEALEYEFFMKQIRLLHGVEGRAAPGLTGLKNLGNSCYMNSTVQCLSNIPQFVDFFTTGSYRRAINYENTLGSKGNVARTFAVLICGLWSGRFKYIIPTQFKQCISSVAPVFAGCDQQDSQEFLVFLLDGLHEDLNLVKERKPIPEQNNDGLGNEEAAHRAWINHERLNSSIIVDIFQGQYLSTVRCRVCRRESRTFDVFMYLSLPVSSDRRCGLEDCLEEFLAPEEMTGDCKWFCPHCARKRDAVKEISIWKLPKVLLIHLKRFSCNIRGREKLQTFVDFPSNRLDMSAYSGTRNAYYTLIGVSNHYGAMESGHYTSYCKNVHDSRWYKYDDHDVTAMSQGSIKTSAAYILYYVAEDYAIDYQG